MSRITEDMTFAEIVALPGMERAAGHLMKVRTESRKRTEQTSVAIVRQMIGDAMADRVFAGLVRLDEVTQELGRPDIDLWDEAAIAEMPERAETRLFRFPGKPGAPFVLVIPGGGYCSVCSALEGFPFAAELNAAGYSAFVLSYRIMGDARMPAPIEDAAQALRVILKHAKELGVSKGYAIAGFSAGAHLAGELCTDNWGWESWGLPRPKALVLNYPAVDTELLAAQPEENEVVAHMLDAMFGETPKPEDIEGYSVVRHVAPNCPPVYLWQAENDTTIPVASSRNMADALMQQGVYHEYVSYPDGDHGLMAPHNHDADLWPQRVITFLKQHL